MPQAVTVRNVTRGTVLASGADVAASPWARARGLLGRQVLPAGAGLVIRPCNSVHSFFMAFPIDVIYLDRGGDVVALTPAMAPNRIGPIVWRAHEVVELPAGTVAATETRVGDRLTLEPTVGLADGRAAAARTLD